MSSKLTVKKSRLSTAMRNKPPGRNSNTRMNPDRLFAAQNMASSPSIKRAKVLMPVHNNQTYDPKEFQEENAENMGESLEVEDREIEEILQLSTDHINTRGGSATTKSTPKSKSSSKYANLLRTVKNNHEKNDARFTVLEKIIKDHDVIIQAFQKRMDDLEQMATIPGEAQGSDATIPPDLSDKVRKAVKAKMGEEDEWNFNL
uniref:Uncharacterized protein n=2 Tax=Clytia hemisphaerica TaxID=252671 RepID=A0A7M5XCX6_9CNID